MYFCCFTRNSAIFGMLSIVSIYIRAVYIRICFFCNMLFIRQTAILAIFLFIYRIFFNKIVAVYKNDCNY